MIARNTSWCREYHVLCQICIYTTIVRKWKLLWWNVWSCTYYLLLHYINYQVVQLENALELNWFKVMTVGLSSIFKPYCSHAGNSTQFMRWRAEGEAYTWSQIQFILRNPWSRSKTKVLQEACEEDEELHPGQTLSNTNPATLKRKKWKRIWSSCLQVSAHQEVMAKFTNLQKKAWRHLAW